MRTISVVDQTVIEAEARAAVFRDGSADARIEPIELGALRDDEVLVRVVAAGICHTDLTCRDGFMALPRPIVLGHEGAGIVERVGRGVGTVAPGDKVVMTFLSCGDCPNCHAGVPAYCHMFMPANMSGRRLDGSTSMAGGGGEIAGHFFGQSSFATHSIATERNVVKVRDVLDPAESDVAARLQEIAGGPLSHAIDTCGIPDVIAQGIEALGARGQIVLVTANRLEAALNQPILPLIGRGITVRGVNMGDSVPKSFIPRLVDLIVEGRFPIEKLVRFYRFEDVNRALEDQADGSAVKPILRMS